MARIPGASLYLNQATLSNLRGVSAQAPNLLGEVAGGVSLLDIGRNLAPRGIGISNSARALNRQFLQQNSGTANQLFSAAGGGSSTQEAALTQIRGLQATVPVSRATPEAREAAQERAAETARGSIVDQNA